MAALPLDIWINVFTTLPVLRSRANASTKTLIACTQVNAVMREAALVSSVWKPHYAARYQHCNEIKEEERYRLLEENWQKMYMERLQLDLQAQHYLDKLVVDKSHHWKYGDLMYELGMDVWDFLELESHCPLPAPFSPLRASQDGSAPAHALPVRVWAKNALLMISRAHAVDVWKKIWPTIGTGRPSFETAITMLTLFAGESHQRVTRDLDHLAVLFRLRVAEKHLPLDAESPDYDLQKICCEICEFMSAQGFHFVTSDRFHDPWNSFPHAFLNDNKTTIPLSLVYVFVSIATRLGINASPINFPGIVLAHVRTLNDDQRPLIVNLSAADPSQAVGQVHGAITPTQIPGHPAHTGELLVPADSSTMLIRASRNILAGLISFHSVSPELVNAGQLISLCVHVIAGADSETTLGFLSSTPPDVLEWILLRNSIGSEDYPGSPAIRTSSQLNIEQSQKKAPKRRGTGSKVKYFVGMSFNHGRYGYHGFIFGWDEECSAPEDWIRRMGINSLPRGRYQPFYNCTSEHGDTRYVAQENILPTSFSLEQVRMAFESQDEFSTNFEGVHLPENPFASIYGASGRGRLLLSPHSKASYPDDDELGARWEEDGTLPE